VPKPREQSDPRRLAAWERVRQLVGRRVRELRVARGLTQEQLALRAGIARNVLVDVELGKSGLLYERLFDLAAALNISANEFLVVETQDVYGVDESF
jgi:transcriptional regulator with XRE-family HTH domain